MVGAIAVPALRPVTKTCLLNAVHDYDSKSDDHLLSTLVQSKGGTTARHATKPMLEDPPAVLLWTSGTTGAPKAVVETLPALWAKASFFAETMRPGPDDVHLMYLPVAHAFGMTLSLLALATGGRLVLTDRFSPERALQLVADENVTVLPGTPTHFTLLLRALDPARHTTETLRWAVSAAAPLPASLADEMYSRLDVEIMHVYGCSEGFLALTTDRDTIRLGSVGSRVFQGPPGTPPDGSVVVLDTDRDVRLAAGEVGEIAYGAAHPVRYWAEPLLATNGWYRTGDLGFIDAGGCTFVLGRLKELINRGGLKVACGEIERALRNLAVVDDCAVIPSPDAVLGEAICACVVPVPGTVPTLGELRSQLRDVLARHKLPDELCLLEEMPRSSLGKVDRSVLSAQVFGNELPRARVREPAPG